MYEDVVQSLMKRIADNVQIEADDYQDDRGIWICGKCKTPKQVEVMLFDRPCRPMCLCRCASERAERERDAFRQEQRAMLIRDRRQACFSDKRMAEWSFENDDGGNPQLTSVMQNYVKNFPELKKTGKGLLLYGGVGSGKTYAACEAVNALIDGGRTAYVTSFAWFINSIQGSYEKQSIIDSLAKPDILVLDDLGAMRDTSFGIEQAYNMVDTRYRSGKPMIVTTNLTISEIKRPDTLEAARIYDRILERCFPVEVTGGNRRRENIRREYDDIKGMLGL